MTTNADKARKAEKAAAIQKRLAEIGPSADLLLGMLDETKLDLLILALGLGHTVLTSDN